MSQRVLVSSGEQATTTPAQDLDLITLEVECYPFVVQMLNDKFRTAFDMMLKIVKSTEEVGLSSEISKIDKEFLAELQSYVEVLLEGDNRVFATAVITKYEEQT